MRIRLREWRIKRRYSLRDLAKRAGVAPMTVFRIEDGRHSPTVAVLEKLARALHVHITDFFPHPSRRR